MPVHARQAPLWSTNDVMATSIKLVTRRRKWVHRVFNDSLLRSG